MSENWRPNAIVGIFALTCVGGLVIYLWACRAILHRAEATLNGGQAAETIGE